MPEIDSIVITITAFMYYYFNWSYFRLVGVLRGFGKQRVGWITCTFVLNYMLFIICSLAELNLIWNWTVFFLFLLAETFLYCKGGGNESAFFSFIGILCGLTVNIFCRSGLFIGRHRIPDSGEAHAWETDSDPAGPFGASVVRTKGYDRNVLISFFESADLSYQGE